MFGWELFRGTFSSPFRHVSRRLHDVFVMCYAASQRGREGGFHSTLDTDQVDLHNLQLPVSNDLDVKEVMGIV